MSAAVDYSAHERLRDGRQILIRALVPDDRDEFLAAIKRTSGQSMYRRFFSRRSEFSENEISYFLDVDFVSHVALIAVLEGSASTIIGGARYIVSSPGEAEVAFVITDDFQGQGAGTALMRHLVLLGRAAGMKCFLAQVLPDNAPMLKVFKASGLPIATKQEQGVTHLRLSLN